MTSATRSMASSASRPVASTPLPRLVMTVRRSSSTTSPFSGSATSKRVVFVPMSMTATGTSGKQLEHPLHGAGEHGTVASHDDRPLEELRVLRHEGDRLVVIHLTIPEAELPVNGLARAKELAGRPPRLPDELPDLLLAERLDVIVDSVEIDA